MNNKLAFSLVVGCLGAAIEPAAGCCCVSPMGIPVGIGDQSNIVIWDAASHTEHFIRLANFRSSAEDFGFIAPTPSKPELSSASPEAFQTVAGLVPQPLSFGCGSGAESTGAIPGGVSVVQEADVAGYHATTLRASDAGALSTWMKRNGYASTPGIEAWTKPYLDRGWYLTAFKVKNASEVASTGTVRMSFKTDRPFNPFFVPSDNIQAGQRGTLKVYFVSSGSYAAHIGSSGTWKDSLWEAGIPWETASRLATQLNLPLSAIPTDAQVEAFQDDDFPRAAADDIYFTPHFGINGEEVTTVAIIGGLLALGIRRVVRKGRVGVQPLNKPSG